MSSAARMCFLQDWVAAISAACARLQGVQHFASDGLSAGTSGTIRRDSRTVASTAADAGRAERLLPPSAGEELTERLREETARLQRWLDSMKLTLKSDSGRSHTDVDTIPALWDDDRPRSSFTRRRSRSSMSLRRAAALAADGDGPPRVARPMERAWRVQVCCFVTSEGCCCLCTEHVHACVGSCCLSSPCCGWQRVRLLLCNAETGPDAR